jgi:Yip1 domain
MPTPAPDGQPTHAGFSLPIDMVVAPGRAFLKIAQTNEWIPGLLVILVLGLGTVALTTPAFVHIVALMKISQPPTRAEIVTQLCIELLAMPALIAMLIATTLTAMTRMKDPKTPFVRYYSLAINCWVPSALGSLLHAAVAAVRQPGAFASFRAYTIALPDSLGALAAPGNERELDFLQRFNIFDAWTFVLLGFGISLFTGMRFATALTLAALMYFAYVLAFNQ